MPTSSRVAILPLLAALALAACSSGVEPTGCRTSDQCPAASRCGSSVCVADGKPVAAIRPLAAVQEFALVQIDGSDSHDPDGDDKVTEHLWSVRAVTARCAPPSISGATPIARARFGCPGRYEVSLAVRDGLGVESEPHTIEVDVTPSTQAPVVVAGPDVSTDHACSGEPLVCRPVDFVDLSASTTVAGLALRWTVEPPLDRPLEDGTRRVELVPGPHAPAPRVSIETDGTAISGDWIFRVEASDAFGVVGAAYTRVSVRNRPPVVASDAPAPFPHAFDAAGARFTSSGEIAWSAVDPDGDPIEIAATWRHVGDGGAPFAGELTAGNATFALEVPYAGPADALLLRGGPDLARTIEIVARDSNRGEGRASVPIEIGNRPPQPAGGVVDARAPHVFDARRSRYVATVQLGAWIDPDGDPLSAGPGTAPCDAVSVVDGLARAECSAPFDGAPAANRIAGHRAVSVPVRDPWSFAAAIPVHGIEILNSPPSLTSVADPATVCATMILDFVYAVSAVEFTASPTAIDPDGDPLVVTPIPAWRGGSATPERAICTTPQCVPFHFVQPAQSLSLFNLRYEPPSWLGASDGAASVVIDVSPTPVRC